MSVVFVIAVLFGMVFAVLMLSVCVCAILVAKAKDEEDLKEQNNE